MKKNKIKTNILCFILFLVISLSYIVLTTVITILYGPETAKSINKSVTNVYFTLIGITILVCFFALVVIVVQVMKFNKFVAEELRYKGVSDEVLKAYEKREEKYRSKPYSINYIDCVNKLSSFYAFNEEYDKAVSILRNLDIENLYESLNLDKKIPIKTNLSLYASYLDAYMSVGFSKKDMEMIDYIYPHFKSFHDKFINKEPFLNLLLYEAKLHYHFAKEEFEAADSVLDILKNMGNPDASLIEKYNQIVIIKLKNQNISKEDLEKLRQEGYALAEKCVAIKYYKDLIDRQCSKIECN